MTGVQTCALPIFEVEIGSSWEILQRLLAGRFQLALVGSEESDERVAVEPYLDDEVVGVARPGLLPLRRGRLEPAALAGHTLLAREPGSGTQRLVDEELQAAGARPAGVWELGSSEALKRAAREGLGVAFLSRYAVAEEVERGELEAFRLAGRPPLRRRFLVARLAGRPPSPAEQAFVATLTQCCAKSADYAQACVGAPRR